MPQTPLSNQITLAKRAAIQPLEIDSGDQRAFGDLRRVVREATRLLSLHRWLFFLPFCLVTSTVFVFSLYLPRQYKATTSFEIGTDAIIANLSNAMTTSLFEKFRGTVEEDLKSPELHTSILNGLGLKGGQKNVAAVRRALGDQLEVLSTSPSEKLDVVQLAYTGPDRQFGQRFLDALRDAYIEKASSGLRDTMLQQREYLREEYDQVRQDVLAAQREETQLRLQNPYLNPTDPGALSIKIAQLEADRRDLLLRRREYESELAALEQVLAGKQAQATPPFAAEPSGITVPPSDATRDLLSELGKLDNQILELRRARGMTDQHPEMAGLLSHRTELNDRLQRQRDADREAFVQTGGAAPASKAESQPEFVRLQDAISAETAKLRETEISLETNQFAIQELQAARNDLFEKQGDFAEVTGQVQKAKARETQLQTTLAQLEPAIRAVEQNRLIHFVPGPPARVGERPVAPNPTTVVLFALFAGLAAGVVGLVLGEVFDQSFHSAEQVAASLNIPLLEVIDEIITAKRGSRLLRRGVLAPAFLALGILLVSGSGSLAYLCVQKPKLYERVRQLPILAAGFVTGSDEG